MVEDGNRNGGGGQLGGKWPDNEFTKLIPTMPFKISAASTDDKSCAFVFAGEPYEQIKFYVQMIKSVGFYNEVEETDMGKSFYSFSAKHDNGYTVNVFYTSGASGVTVEAPNS